MWTIAKGTLDKTKYQMLKSWAGLLVSHNKICNAFPRTSLCKTSGSGMEPFSPQDHNLNNLGKVPLSIAADGMQLSSSIATVTRTEILQRRKKVKDHPRIIF